MSIKASTPGASECRACLKTISTTENAIYLFNRDENCTEYETTIADLFYKCTLLKISKDESFTFYLCKKCYEKLTDFHKFREMCVASYFELQKRPDPDGSDSIDRCAISVGLNNKRRVESDDDNDDDGRDDVLVGFDNKETDNPNGVVDKEQGEVPVGERDDLIEELEQVQIKTEDPLQIVAEDESYVESTEMSDQDVNFGQEFEQITANDADLLTENNIPIKIEEVDYETLFSSPNKSLILNTANDDTISNNGFSSESTHSCYFCPEFFNSKLDLQTHLETMHNGIEEFTCYRCGSNKRTKEQLIIHMNVHTKEIEYRCELCLKIYYTDFNLRLHFKRGHNFKKLQDQRFQCTVCDKTLDDYEVARSYLGIHRTRKNSIAKKREYKYKCSECNQLFQLKTNLERHMLKHKGIQNFPCSICGERKLTKYELKRHIMDKHSIVEHPCELCSMVFKTADKLKNHRKSYHNVKKVWTRYHCILCNWNTPNSDLMKHHLLLLKHTEQIENSVQNS